MAAYDESNKWFQAESKTEPSELSDKVENDCPMNCDIFRLYNLLQLRTLTLDCRSEKEFNRLQIYDSVHLNIPVSHLNDNHSIHHNLSDYVDKNHRCSTPKQNVSSKSAYNDIDEPSLTNNRNVIRQLRQASYVVIIGNTKQSTFIYELLLPICGNQQIYKLGTTVNAFYQRFPFLCIKLNHKMNNESTTNRKNGLIKKLDNLIYHCVLDSICYPNIIAADGLYLGNAMQATNTDVILHLGITHIINVTQSCPNKFDKKNYSQLSNGDLSKLAKLSKPIKYFNIIIEDLSYIPKSRAKQPRISHYFEKVTYFINRALYKHTTDANSNGHSNGNSAMQISKQNPNNPFVTISTDAATHSNSINGKTKASSMAAESSSSSAKKEKKRKNFVLIHCMAGVSRSATITIAYLMRYQKMSLFDAYTYVSTQCRPQICPNPLFFRELVSYEIRLFGEQHSTEKLFRKNQRWKNRYFSTANDWL